MSHSFPIKPNRSQALTLEAITSNALLCDLPTPSGNELLIRLEYVFPFCGELQRVSQKHKLFSDGSVSRPIGKTMTPFIP